jgi:hypothetical protein
MDVQTNAHRDFLAKNLAHHPASRSFHPVFQRLAQSTGTDIVQVLVHIAFPRYMAVTPFCTFFVCV